MLPGCTGSLHTRVVCYMHHAVSLCLQEVLALAATACAPVRGQEHWALLAEAAQAHDSKWYHNVLLTLTAIHWVLHRKLSAGEHEVNTFLEENGISAVKASAASHSLIRPSKRRRSGKPRKSKHKKRKSREVRLERDGTDSADNLDDLDLGIMSDGDVVEVKQANELWHIISPGNFDVHVLLDNLPPVLLNQALCNWLKWLS